MAGLGVGTRSRGGLTKRDFPEGCGSRELGQAEACVALGVSRDKTQDGRGLSELQAPSPLPGRDSSSRDP